jgi:hypothetical protein
MLQGLKVNCKKHYYLENGDCRLFKDKNKACLKANCIYFNGENKNV